MSNVFKFNIVIMIIAYYFASSIFASTVVSMVKTLIPIVMIMIWILQMLMLNKKINKIPTYTLTLFSIFFIFCFTSIFMSKTIFLSILELLGLLSLFILSFFIVPEHVKCEDKYISFIKLFNKTLVIILIVGIIIGLGNTTQTFTNFGNRFRYRSILSNANSLGAYTMLGSIISIILTYITKRRRYIITLLFNMVLLSLSDSRTSLFTVAIFLFVLILFHNYKKDINRKTYIWFFVFLMFILIISSVPLLLNEMRYVSIEGLNDLLSGRIDRWLNPFKEIRYATLIFGTGANNSFSNPHNFFINAIINWGLASSVIFLLIVVFSFIDIFKNTKPLSIGQFTYKKNIIILSLIVAFISFSFFESMFFNVGNLVSVFLWSNIGIAISNTNIG